MYKEGLVTEIHLWNFTWRDYNVSEREFNQEWIRKIAEQYSFVKVLESNENSFIPFYRFYSQNTSDQDVVIKADDDIVFVNVSEVKCFVKFVATTKEAFIVSTNVVNNGVIAYVQQCSGVIPLSLERMEYPSKGKSGTLWGSPEKAYYLHKYFVTHQEDFFQDAVFRYWARLSVNCFAYSGRNANKAYKLVSKDGDDEHQLTTVANKAGAVSLIYMRLVVAHATYHPQGDVEDWTERILGLYEDLK